MRNGADFSVFINTGQEFDGSDSGARPDEAISWGKIKVSCYTVRALRSSFKGLRPLYMDDTRLPYAIFCCLSLHMQLSYRIPLGGGKACESVR